MYPHERSLVQRLQGRPFVLLGVNTDKDREDIKRVVREEGLNWRSWWDGEDKRITAQWGITGFPTIVLIDHQGVIRHVDLYEKELDKAIDHLVQQAESAAK
jgi:protein-disulfide isomerase-like protein with CxxC motif